MSETQLRDVVNNARRSMNTFLDNPCKETSDDVQQHIKDLDNSFECPRPTLWQTSKKPFPGGWSLDLMKDIEFVPMRYSWYNGLPEQWGYGDYEALTDEQLEERAGQSVDQVLHHLRHGTGFAHGKGLDSELERFS